MEMGDRPAPPIHHGVLSLTPRPEPAWARILMSLLMAIRSLGNVLGLAPFLRLSGLIGV